MALPANRYAIGDRYGWVCRYCLCPCTPATSHLEHVVPVSARWDRDFTWHEANYVLACRSCNLSKGPRDPVEWYFRLGGRARQYPGLLSFIVEMAADVGVPPFNPRIQPPPEDLARRWVELGYLVQEDILYDDPTGPRWTGF